MSTFTEAWVKARDYVEGLLAKSWHTVVDPLQPALEKLWADFKEHLPEIEAAALKAALAAAQKPSDNSKFDEAYGAAKQAAIGAAMNFGLDEMKVLGSARLVAVNAATKATAEPPSV